VGVTVLCPTFFQSDVVKSGRFADARSRELAEKMIRRGVAAEAVVAAALEAVERDELYCVPQADGRWIWRVKRFSPDLYRYMVTRTARRM
jgi:short-subunit dehydrogenase